MSWHLSSKNHEKVTSKNCNIYFQRQQKSAICIHKMILYVFSTISGVSFLKTILRSIFFEDYFETQNLHSHLVSKINFFENFSDKFVQVHFIKRRVNANVLIFSVHECPSNLLFLYASHVLFKKTKKDTWCFFL